MEPSHHIPLAAALSLTPHALGYTATVTADWAQGRAAFGGLVAGLLARAMERAIPAGRPARSLLVDFVAPVAPGEVQLSTTLLRTGRALSHAEAKLTQGGNVCAVMVGTFGVPTGSTLVIDADPPPPCAPASAYPRSPYLEGLMPRFVRHFDQRWLGPDLPFTGRGRGELLGYVAHAAPAPSDLAGLLALIDAWPPAVLPALTKPAAASTATWMVDVLAPLGDPDALTTEHHLYQAKTVAARGGYASTESRIWSPSGALLAASRQLTLEFS
jgi:acyl-CoA thioesterase